MVLSIDFDFIMEPCIQLYNDIIDGYSPHLAEMWNDIITQRDLNRYLSVNEENYKFICDLLTKYASDTMPIYIANDHSAILTALNTEIIKGLAIPLDIINIDHHHDIFYNDRDKRVITEYKEPDCGNWVYFLDSLNILHGYFWIKNQNSEPFAGNNMDLNLSVFLAEDKINVETDNLNIDCICLTSSFPWIPPKFYNLYYGLIRLVEKNYNEKNIVYLTESFNQARLNQNLSKTFEDFFKPQNS